jgi:(R)-2-hydroxyglutarate---pyruvate transhydrogenase
LEKLLESELVTDGVLAQDQSQQDLFWEIRESISDSCKRDGGLYKYDLSVPVKDLYSVVLDVRQEMRERGLYHPDTIVPGGIKQILGFGQ